jgi:hypothetical protein
MFRKIVSNLPFSPALIGQLGFYANRLRKEEATRRIGLIFTALALVVQGFAIFSPPESANAANGNNIIYGGFRSKEEMLGIYDQNRDSAGHTDIQQVYTQFGITRQDIANSTQTNFNSRDFNLSIKSVGRSTYEWQRDPIAIAGTSTTVYESLLYKFDSTSWTTVHGSTYPALIGKRAADGQWFAIMMGCGNPAYITLPPPPPQPTASCSALTIAPLNRTRFSFSGATIVSNGATISSYNYEIKDNTGKIIDTRSVASTQATNTINYDFAKDGSYTITLAVTTSVGSKTAQGCQKQLTVSPEPRCPLNSDITASNPDCKPCEDDKTIWYKDKDCKSSFELNKTVRNVTQLVENASGTTAKPGDRLEYKLSVKNTGKTSGSYIIQDNLADVLEYADMIDTGGGLLSKKDPFTPIEKVNSISWPAIEVKPGETIQKIINVKIKDTIPATPQSVSNPESYNCRLVNDFSGHQTVIMVDCPAPKAVEQVVSELPKTGATENLIFAGVILAVVTYFYTRARQMKKEIRLVRKDLNAGTI